MGFFPNIRALHIVMGILLVIILISPPSSIKAQEESQTWSGSAEAGTGLDFSLTGLELANGSIAATKATADNQNAPHARAQASQLAGGLLGLSGNFAESTQTAPPDNANPVSDQMAVNLPLLGSIGLTETQAHARWPQEVADAVCTTDDVVLSRASATTANAKLGSINLLLVSYDVLSYEDGISNESIVTLPESPGGMKQPRGMVAKSTSTLGRISLMNGLVTIDVDGVAELAASVTGEPGGTRIEYKPPDLVEVNASILGDPLVLSLGQSVDLSLLGLFTVTVSLGEPTNIVEQADGTYASANVPILRAQVNLLAGATTILDAVLSELSVEASVPEGGIACSADPDEPLITGLVPAEGPVTGGTEVTVTGEHFIVGETSVTIGDITIPATQVTVDGPTQLTFETPPVEEPGIVQVTVTTPGGTSDPLQFTYTPVPPIITDIQPDEGPVTGGTTVTLIGEYFIDGDTVVTIGTVTIPAGQVTVISTTELSFLTPAVDAPGTVQVTVTTPGGTSDPLDFTYTAVTPIITGLDPDEGPVTGDTVVTVTGDFFIPGDTSVTIGAVTIPAVDVTVIGPTELTFVTPAVAESGPVQVTVTTPGGTSDPLNFTYLAVPPIITSLDPDEGPVTGGTTVTVEGEHFIQGDTSVTIGDISIPAAQVTVNSTTQLTFVTPAVAEPGIVQVRVTTPGGTSDPLQFTYTPVPPIITDIQPDEGPVTGGTTVTLIGEYFIDGDTVVTIGTVTIPAGQVTVISTTELSFLTPAVDAPGTVQVTVTTPGGTSDPLDFTYTAVTPIITGLDPDEGPVTGDTVVTVTGDFFIPGDTSVTIGAVTIPAVDVTVIGPTELTFVTPAVAESGTVQVTVTTPGGTSDPLTFTYTATIFNGVGNGSTVRVHQPKGFTLRIVPNVSSIPAGDEYTYTAIYTNQNQSAAANVVLAFDLPDLLMGIRNDASSINDINNEADFHYDEAANQVVFKMANIEPGHGSTVSFPVKVDTASRDGDVLIIEGRLDTGSGNPAQSVTAQSDPVYVANHIYLSYFQGYPDSTFGPERPLTRAEAAAVTARFLGLRAAPRSIFPDVPEDHWAAGYITAVYDASIMKGDSLGNFNPEAPITRSEMTATVLRVMVDEENVVRYSHFGPAPSTYQDVGASHWSYDYLRLGQELHITHPMAGHLYHPDEAISRADAAVLIALSLRRGELIDGDTPVRQVFADVDRNHWAFGWIAQVTLPDHRGVNIDQHTMLLIEYLND